MTGLKNTYSKKKNKIKNLVKFFGDHLAPLCAFWGSLDRSLKPLVEHLLFKGQVWMWLFECLRFSPGHWMKAHSKPRSFGQSPVSRTMSWLCLEGLFMGPRYEPSMHCPRPVLLGSPHQPQSGCSKHWPHVRKPEQFWAEMTENRDRWEAKEKKASRFWEIKNEKQQRHV